MRAIDADKIPYIQAINESFEPTGKFYARREDIDAMPTIEPERKRGKWIDAEWENINSGEKRKGRRCSVCGHGYFRYDVSVNTVSDIPNFCPNCGADMRGEQDG